jgi:hypothetical protein
MQRMEYRPKGPFPAGAFGGILPRRFRYTFSGTDAFRAVLSSILALSAACSDKPAILSPGNEHLAVSLVSRALTPEIAASLNSNGEFVNAGASVGSQYPEISATQAAALALFWGHNIAPYFYRYLERGHGGPVDFKSLSVCGRTFYARTAISSVPSEIPEPYRRSYGPWFLTTLCDMNSAPAVSVAVSAWATDLAIQNGRLMRPHFSGNEFFGVGIPAGHVGEYPASPETAAALAATGGSLVSSIPELIMPLNTRGAPQSARWHVRLNEPVSLQSVSSSAVTATELFIGPISVDQPALVAFVRAARQTPNVAVRWSPAPLPSEGGSKYFQRIQNQLTTSGLTIRQDVAVDFDAVTHIGGR